MAVLSTDECERLKGWLAETGELWVDIHLVHGGCSSTDYFVRSVGELEELIYKQTHAELKVSVFRHLQFPLRGVADESLLAQALQQIPDGKWYHIISLDHYYPSEVWSLGSGNSHAELRREFPEILGQRVGVGQNPFDNPCGWINTSPNRALVIRLKKEAGKYVRSLLNDR
jgi:hypothetical protein